MAGTKTGVPSIIRLSRKICKLVAVYGAGNLTSTTSAEFAAAVAALVLACQALEALDDQPFEIDSTLPIRVGEDIGS
jgi:tetrahydromethanopterin S-methyltransferase subunit C